MIRRRQKRHHGDEADRHAAATDDAHLLNAAKIGREHGQKSSRRGESTRNHAHAREDQRQAQCLGIIGAALRDAETTR